MTNDMPTLNFSLNILRNAESDDGQIPAETRCDH